MQMGIPLLRLVARKDHLPRAAVFSGRTAGWLHGLNTPPCDPIEVTLPRTSRTSRLSGITLTRSDVSQSEISVLHDLAVTSGTRTTADLARRVPMIDAVIVVEAAVRMGVTSIEHLGQWVDAHRGFRGVSRLRAAIELAEPRSESPMETRLRLLLVAGGLPKPGVQVALYDESGMFLARPDLYYENARLVLEYDGGWHRDRLVSDNRRQNRLVDAGYRVLRFTAGDIFNSPAGLVSLVRRNLLERLSELTAPRLG